MGMFHYPQEEDYEERLSNGYGVHRMFTYVGGSLIFILVKVNRKDERIANNKERTYYFRIDDVYGDGSDDVHIRNDLGISCPSAKQCFCMEHVSSYDRSKF